MEAVQPAERHLHRQERHPLRRRLRVEHQRNPGWKRGIRVGSVRDGKVTAFIPDPEEKPDASATSGAEGVAADAQGNIFGAEVGPKMIKKYVRK